ncbi:DsrH/TusB family sulfur metabolism protein [Methanobacterium sp. ACI-7]|uniref:DsrH/TusB family sulfur metabolism protein n=1 Tax=unclassified Methanobacterium TaxID=2627676 RepID=UPI0039C1578C
MQIAIILTRTPAETGFNTFLKFASIYAGKEELTAYFVGNGIFSAIKGHSKESEIKKLIENSSIYVYLDDMEARGVSKEDLIDGMLIFESYDNIVVNIMENKDQILSF